MPSTHTTTSSSEASTAALTLTPGRADLAMLRRIQAGGVRL